MVQLKGIKPSFDLYFLYIFSRQITDSTWKSQVSQWETFILSYTRQKHIFRLDLHQATTPGGIEIFENRKINRRLSFETLQEIIDEMVQKGNPLSRDFVFCYAYLTRST